MATGDNLRALARILGVDPDALEAAATMLSGSVAQPVAGIVGMAARPGTDRAQLMKDIQEGLTYQPRGPNRALEQMGTIGELVQRARDAAGGAAEAAGAPPWLSAGASALPDAAMLAMPFLRPLAGRVAEVGGAPAAGSRAAQFGKIGEERVPVAGNVLGDLTGDVGKVSAEGLSTAGRAKRVVGTTGQYVGAPPGVDSPAAYNAQINRYVKRIDEALDNGVPRGYFYARGTEANRAVTDNPLDAGRIAMTQGVTSSEAPVKTNTGWAVKALEQDAMGAPIYSGKYPNAMKDKLERVLSGDFSFIGEKTHRYSSGLAGDELGLAPNDRWEIRSFGYNTDTAGPAQHAYMDEVRQKAIERWNKAHPDQPPLSVLEGQELNWATQRARDMGITHQEAASDTIQDSLRQHTIQHSWESRPGRKSGELPNMQPDEWQTLHDQITGTLLNEQGKDKLATAMGATLQFPAIHGPGVFEGQIAPGTQTRTVGYMTQAHGLDPTTEARVAGTEAMRAYLLGQDAYAYHGFDTPKGLSGPKTDTMHLELGRGIASNEARTLQDLLDSAYGAENSGVVPTETGARVLRTSNNPKFSKQFASDVAPNLEGVFGQRGEVTPGTRYGDYRELDWQGRNATANLLDELGNPAAPRMLQRADSPDVRRIAADIARLYEQRKAAGQPINEQLQAARNALATQGLQGLRDLMAKGLAPVAAGAGLYGLYAPQENQ